MMSAVRSPLASTRADAPPISLGAASRPREAPIPMVTMEISDVPSDRPNDSLPSPFQIESSISDFPLV